jgi:hypothetical protein
MPEIQTKKAETQPQDLRQMKHLTNELIELLKRASQIVLPQSGIKGTEYNVVGVILPSAENPMQISFQNSRILNVEASPTNVQADEIGYYIDPPGVCTTVPACIPE